MQFVPPVSRAHARRLNPLPLEEPCWHMHDLLILPSRQTSDSSSMQTNLPGSRNIPVVPGPLHVNFLTFQRLLKCSDDLCYSFVRKMLRTVGKGKCH